MSCMREREVYIYTGDHYTMVRRSDARSRARALALSAKQSVAREESGAAREHGELVRPRPASHERTFGRARVLQSDARERFFFSFGIGTSPRDCCVRL